MISPKNVQEAMMLIARREDTLREVCVQARELEKELEILRDYVKMKSVNHKWVD